MALAVAVLVMDAVVVAVVAVGIKLFQSTSSACQIEGNGLDKRISEKKCIQNLLGFQKLAGFY